MRGSSIVLLGAVALAVCVNAHPYSKIPDAHLQGDGYNYKKSSSNSNSNSYSQSNEDNAEIYGVLSGQSFTGSKRSGYSSSGGSHSQSNSFASGSFSGSVPLGIAASSASPSASAYDGSHAAYGAPANPGTGSLGLTDNGAASFGALFAGSNAGGVKGGVKGGAATGFAASSANAVAGSGFGGQNSGFNHGGPAGSFGQSTGSGGQNSGFNHGGSAGSFGQSTGSGGQNSGFNHGGSAGSFGQSTGSGGQNSGYNHGGSTGSGGQNSGFNHGGSTGFGGQNSGFNHDGSTGSFGQSTGSGTGQYGANDGSQGSFGHSGSAGSSAPGSTVSGIVSAGGASGTFGQSGVTQGNLQYWWSGPNSPFGPNGKPLGGCTSAVCSAGGTFDLSKGSGSAFGSNSGGQVAVNIQGNPFLNKGLAGSSAFGSTPGFPSSVTPSSPKPFDGSKNPFFGAAASFGSSGSTAQPGSTSFGTTHVPSHDSTPNTVSHPNTISVGNPFFQGSSGSSHGTAGAQVPQFPSQQTPSFPSSQSPTQIHLGGSTGIQTPPQQLPTFPGSQSPTQTHFGSSNPFLKPDTGASAPRPSPTPSYSAPTGNNVPQVPAQLPSFPSKGTSLPQFPKLTPELPAGGDGGLTVSCSGQGKICVVKNLCSNGLVNTNGQGLMQVRTGVQYCKLDREVCCTLQGYSGAPSQSNIVQGVDFPQSNQAGTTADAFASSTSSANAASGGDQSNSEHVEPSKTGFGQTPTFGSSTSFGSQPNTGFGHTGTTSFGQSNFGNDQSKTGFGQTGKFGATATSGQPGSTGGQSGTGFGHTGKFGATATFGQPGSTSGQSGTGFGDSGSTSFGQSSSGNDQSKNGFGQTGKFGSFGQSGSAGDQSNTGFGQSGSSSFGQSGSSNDQSKTDFGQADKFGSAGPSNFGRPSTISTSFGTGVGAKGQSGSGLIHVTPSGASSFGSTISPSADSSLIHVTPSSGGLFDSKPGASSSSVRGNTGFDAGSNANANAGAFAQAGSSSGFNDRQGTKTTGGGLFGNQHKQTGGLFGSDNSGEDFNTGEPAVKGTNFGAKGSSIAEINGYLPALGSEPSSNVPAFSRPPQEVEGGASDTVPNARLPPTKQVPFPPAPEVSPQVGCAAALICVEEQFCTLEGVISPEPVALSSQQLERRVPLSTCKNPDNGIIGKCCRDPNYVDPWPTGNLPANYSGGFDEQGFPTFLNIAKTRPPKTPSTGIKVTPHQPTKTISPSQFPTLPPQIANIPNQISNLFPGNPFQKPTVKPDVPPSSPDTDGSNVAGIPASPPEPLPGIPSKPPSGGLLDNFPNLPNFPSLPSLPNLPNPFGKPNYDSASSNQSPTIIAPHTPGSHCGLKNKVQRPSGLSDEDVAFGEIPWQAMILSTRDRKLLCSGSIVAPNAILTTAHCVEGLKPSEVSIKTGEWKLGYELKNEEPYPFEIVKVASIVQHPGYYPNAPSYDLAVLFLEHPVKLDQHVDTICIGDSPQPKPGRKCISTGWGKTVLQVNVAGALMHGIPIELLPPDVCEQRLQGAENHIDLDETLVCAKPQKQKNNMCQVDVGGPLACDRGDGYYELTGVYSQDTGCLPTNQVATFALVDTDWVKKILDSPAPLPGKPEGESQSPSNVNRRIEPHVHPNQQPCDCQKSNLPPGFNQYLPAL